MERNYIKNKPILLVALLLSSIYPTKQIMGEIAHSACGTSAETAEIGIQTDYSEECISVSNLGGTTFHIPFSDLGIINSADSPRFAPSTIVKGGFADLIRKTISPDEYGKLRIIATDSYNVYNYVKLENYSLSGISFVYGLRPALHIPAIRIQIKNFQGVVLQARMNFNPAHLPTNEIELREYMNGTAYLAVVAPERNKIVYHITQAPVEGRSARTPFSSEQLVRILTVFNTFDYVVRDGLPKLTKEEAQRIAAKLWPHGISMY